MPVRSSEQLLDIAKRLISIESVALNPDGLREAYDVIVQMLITCGKNITIEHFEKDGIPSLLAYRGPHQPDNFRIMLNGHVDVVPGKPSQFKPVLKNGKLYGRGSHDMKAAAVILTDVFCEYVDKVPYALGLQIVTDEESSGLRGTKYQIESGVRADFVICGECGRDVDKYEIANECKGMAVVELEFGGTSAHGAYLWKGENAILRATKFADALLKRYPLPAQEVHHTTVNISSIATNNTAHTKVPDHASMRLDIRFANDDPHFRSKQHLAALVEELDPLARITDIPSLEPPFYSSPKNPLFMQLKAAAEKIEGHKFEAVKRHGTSDGRYYGLVGDQACEFGIAGRGHHSNNEYITVDAFEKYHKTMQAFLAKSIKTEANHTNTIAYIARP